MNIKKFENFVPSGWVNVKLDEELHIRIARYVESLDTLLSSEKDKYNLFEKISLLSNKEKILEADIRTKISIITILQYLKEIKSKFNPSSSGFLLEGFLAALIHGEIISDNGYSDIRSRTPEKLLQKKRNNKNGNQDDSELNNLINLSYDELNPVNFKTKGGDQNNPILNYQIKLYKDGSSINVTWGDTKCDYYVICVKKNNTISIKILNGKDVNDDSFIAKYCTTKKGIPEIKNGILNPESYERVSKTGARRYITLSYAKLRDNFKTNTKILDFNIMQDIIDSCGEDIKKSIENVYEHLSELHYDIDSLVSGYNKEKISVDIDTASEKSIESSNNIIQEVGKLNKGLSS